MTRRTRCVTVAVGATVRTARQLIHPVRKDMLLSPPNLTLQPTPPYPAL
jgi:hypothetical protein